MQLICVDEQYFPKIREKSGVYVDKTRIMYNLFKDGSYFFISRPRRFGKSTLCSALASLFAGKRELFKGLWIEKSDWQWEAHPVIHLDMTRAAGADFDEKMVKHALANELSAIAAQFGVSEAFDAMPSVFFANLIKKLYEKTGKRVVVIIDEYDKPLLDVIHHKDRYPAIHEVLRSTYTQLKASSEYLRFVFMTGVFKFAKTSVFSGLNNITDLTFAPQAAELLGYTEQEIVDSFPEHLAALGKKLSKSQPELLNVLREQYNGYTFGIDTDMSGTIGSVYNPFAINHVFHAQQLIKQWFASATPTFLIKKLQEHTFVGIDQSELVVDFNILKDSCNPDEISALSLLYYAGYVTLKSYNHRQEAITLDFPNAEVAQSFSQALLPAIAQKTPTSFGILTRKINDLLYDENLSELKDTLNQALAMVPYHLFGTHESYYQTIIYLLFNASSVVTVAEDMSNRGRADITVLLPKTIYIFELKMNQPAAVAIEQVKQRDYAAKYRHLGKQIYFVGIELSDKDRIVKDILVEKQA